MPSGMYLIFKPSLFVPMLSFPAEECSYWLPLYGSMCCRLAAQPRCMTQQMMSGCLKVKVSSCRCDFLFLWAFPILTGADEGQTSFVVQMKNKKRSIPVKL